MSSFINGLPKIITQSHRLIKSYEVRWQANVKDFDCQEATSVIKWGYHQEDHMDSVLSTIMMILGKYAPDRGDQLGREVGLKALNIATEIFTLILAQLRQTAKGDVLATGYEHDPLTYERAIELELSVALQADPDFAAKLKNLVAQYGQAAQT
jgi:hypothetical protein